MKIRILITITLFFILLCFPIKAEVVRDLIFPLAGSGYAVEDNFGDPRWGNDVHEGIDIMADKMTSILSATDGVVTFIADPQEDWGYAVVIKDDDGYRYWYLHINNDTPGTDDGAGGTVNAYAPGIKRGVSVKAGQAIAWVGDSGNAENTGSHLHFEIHEPDGTIINPYYSLLQARYPGA
ncbi:MAG: M23 family metallopeptidase, partial [Candidatus Komeilibacteria bacterium]|nr:M23 family metallopeptidase [Candidatus Komeilibacteria bacterium]